VNPAAPALALFLVCAAPGFDDLRPPQPADERGKELEGWQDLACARCHADVAREWSTTLHAHGWVDPEFQQQLADTRRPESCHGCHAPQPLHVATGADGSLQQKPPARDLAPKTGDARGADAHFGISCESCHRGQDDVILGPWGAEHEAHRSAKHASFLPESRSELCVACHATNVGPVIGIAKDFVETEQHQKGRSCVACHMAPVERPAAAEPGKDPRPARPGRSHLLQTPRDPSFLARALELRAERRGSTVVLVVANACGHRVPGLIGRKLRLDAELVGADGAVTARGTLTLETKRSLPVDGVLEIQLPGAGAQVRVLGTHEAPALPREVHFLEATVPVP
jgi:hypothetical protein